MAFVLAYKNKNTFHPVDEKYPYGARKHGTRESMDVSRVTLSRATYSLAPHAPHFILPYYFSHPALSRAPCFFAPSALWRGKTAAQGWNHVQFLLFQHQE